MFCTKCGKQVDDDIKFCPGCGSSFGDAVSNSSPDRGGESNSWLKIGKIAVVTVGLVACVAIGYLRASKADAIDSKENLSIIAELVTKSIVAIEELKPIAKVRGCTSVSLDMNFPLESLEEGRVRKVYKGIASVEMFPRKSSSESEDSIEYASSAVTVRYDIMVVDAGKEIVLKEAEMRDADWTELLVATGLFDKMAEDVDKFIEEGDKVFDKVSKEIDEAVKGLDEAVKELDKISEDFSSED